MPKYSRLAWRPRHALHVEVDSDVGRPVNSNTSAVASNAIIQQLYAGFHCCLSTLTYGHNRVSAIVTTTLLLLPFYSHTGQPALAGIPVWRILLEQRFTAHMLLLTATSTLRSGRRHRVLLHRLRTFHYYTTTITNTAFSVCLTDIISRVTQVWTEFPKRISTSIITTIFHAILG